MPWAITSSFLFSSPVFWNFFLLLCQTLFSVFCTAREKTCAGKKVLLVPLKEKRGRVSSSSGTAVKFSKTLEAMEEEEEEDGAGAIRPKPRTAVTHCSSSQPARAQKKVSEKMSLFFFLSCCVVPLYFFEGLLRCFFTCVCLQVCSAPREREREKGRLAWSKNVSV